MDLNSAGGTPKRSRAKPKVESDAGAASKPARPRTRKAKPQPAEPIEVTSITAIAKPADDELAGMIARAAYFIAEHRNFAPGHELDDWLEAERQIRTLHT